MRSSNMYMAELDALHAFTFKVASRCNLNCTYCYVYNKGDDSWKSRPSLMSNETFSAGIRRIRELCLQTGRQAISIAFHGGEPCLVGPPRLDRWCAEARKELDGVATVRFVIQTNGTLLDERWTAVLSKHGVEVGISLDGPAYVNDQFRLTRKGLGSYTAVERGIRSLRAAGLDFAILSVINFDADPIETHRHFIDLGATGISYLMPDHTHETIGEVRKKYGPTPCAEYLIRVFDEWWFNNTMHISVQPFWTIAEMILGGVGRSDNYGTQPLGFMFVEADGMMEGLDVLRICENGITQTPLNVMKNSFAEFAATTILSRRFVLDPRPIPDECHGCREIGTCSGGYLPHRYSRARGFANRSAWCADILRLFTHIRNRLGVSASETELRRQLLATMAREAAAAAPRVQSLSGEAAL
jgi:uncharacterized protein